MNIIVNARHVEVSDAIKQYAEEKASKLPKFYNNVMSIEVILDRESDKSLVELIVSAAHHDPFVASHRDDDMYACIDQCMDKITNQLRRFKDKVRDRQGPPHGQIPEQGL